MSEAFQRWLAEFLRDKGRSPLDHEIWQAALAHEREPMACGHPRACWSGPTDHDRSKGCFLNTETGYMECQCEYQYSHCLACEAVKQAVDEREKEFTRISEAAAALRATLREIADKTIEDLQQQVKQTRDAAFEADLQRIGPCCGHPAKNHRKGTGVDGKPHFCDVCDTQAETVERCLYIFSNEYGKALREGSDGHGAYDCAMDAVRALSPDPEWLPNLIKRKELEARRDEARWWETFSEHSHQVRENTRIADLDRQIAALRKERTCP